MSRLRLAVHIAEAVVADAPKQSSGAEAKRLRTLHPEADVTEGEIAETLAELRAEASLPSGND